MTHSARVIVVGAEATYLSSTKRFLASVGYEVEAYPDAVPLFDSVPNEEPTCMLLDLHMPGMGGLEARERLVKRGHDHPVVFVTGHGADVPASVEAMKRGAVDVLLKGCDGRQLLDAIERSLRKDAVDHAARTTRQQARARFGRLTRRERQVCMYLMKGMLNKQIAAQLWIAESTVKVHRSRMMEKLGVYSLVALMRLIDHAGVTPADMSV